MLIAAVGVMAPLAGLPLDAMAQGMGGSSGSKAPSQATPPAPKVSPDEVDPNKLFATSCGWCHQQGGRAQGRGPKLAGSPRSDEFIIDRIKKGKPGAMPAFARALSDAQIEVIVAYIRGLDPGGD